MMEMMAGWLVCSALRSSVQLSSAQLCVCACMNNEFFPVLFAKL